jgi:hypothetical protein
MERLSQEARMRQGVVNYAEKHGKSEASRKYGVSLSSVKRWKPHASGPFGELENESEFIFKFPFSSMVLTENGSNDKIDLQNQYRILSST